jgi:hypothetical protein
MVENLNIGEKIESWSDFSLAIMIGLVVFIGDFILRHI